MELRAYQVIQDVGVISANPLGRQAGAPRVGAPLGGKGKPYRKTHLAARNSQVGAAHMEGLETIWLNHAGSPKTKQSAGQKRPACAFSGNVMQGKSGKSVYIYILYNVYMYYTYVHTLYIHIHTIYRWVWLVLFGRWYPFKG